LVVNVFFIHCPRFAITMTKTKTVKTKIIKKKPEKEKSSSSMKQVLSKKKESSNTTSKEPAIAKPSKPEPKNKLVLEYIIYASQKLLFEFITSPSGLSEWFADDVTIQRNIYTFVWDGAKQQAEALSILEGKSIRLRWTDRPNDTYFEFRIEKNELTYELSLVITDFAETAEDKNSLEVLWQGQVQRLMKVIGSKA
jgi:uncharacterized protein YndB with AHSA1/START domain